MKQITFCWIGLFLAPCLASCGFQFAGSHPVSPGLSPLYLQTSGLSREMERNLREVLQYSAIEKTDQRGESAAILHVHDEKIDRRILSINTGARVREFELRYQVTFGVRTPDGKDLIKPQTLELFRDYSYDEFSILGKENEDETMRAELARDAVNQIMRRLRIAMR